MVFVLRHENFVSTTTDCRVSMFPSMSSCYSLKVGLFLSQFANHCSVVYRKRSVIGVVGTVFQQPALVRFVGLCFCRSFQTGVLAYPIFLRNRWEVADVHNGVCRAVWQALLAFK